MEWKDIVEDSRVREIDIDKVCWWCGSSLKEDRIDVSLVLLNLKLVKRSFDCVLCYNVWLESLLRRGLISSKMLDRLEM